MRDDTPLAAGQPRRFASGWYRISRPWPGDAGAAPAAPAAPVIVLVRAGSTADLVYPMDLSAGEACGIVAVEAGDYRLRLHGGGVDVVDGIRVEALARAAALRAMWTALVLPEDQAAGTARLASLGRILPGSWRGPSGLVAALVAEYRRRVFLRCHRRLGRQTGQYRASSRPWASREALLVHPARELRRSSWLLHGDAPAEGFALRRALPGLAIEPGWHLLQVTCRAVDDDAPSPSLSLQPDHGHGPLPDRGVFLSAQTDDGRWQQLVMFDGPSTGLWLKPMWQDVALTLESFELVRVGRLRALWTMLRGLAAGGGSIRGEGLRFAREAATQGLTAAADALHRRYRRRHDLGVEPYDAWVSHFDVFGEREIARLRARGAALADGPTISVLVPTYNTPLRWLRRCLDSVLAQAYPRWQLCIADDASTDPAVRKLLREYAAKDARIRVAFRDRNGHISEASNSALGLATGDYVALLDHDDELRPHALLEMAEAIAADPALDLLYSDEDKLDGDGRRFDPYFKPDWNPDLLRSQNYVCHLSVVRTALVREVGGFRTGFEGSQDHDLILRCSERLDAGRIHHVPKVLYHWRAIEGSTALVRDAKDYAAAAGARAVEEHLARCHPGARAEELSHGHYRVRWPLPAPAPKASLLVPTRDRVELLRTCVESLLERTDYPDFEVVVVDNQSSEPEALAYLDELAGRDRVRVLRYDAPFNYSAINNWAAAQCDGAILGLVNNDIEVIARDWLSEMVSHAVRPEIGAVGAMLYYPDDSIQHAGVVLGIHGVAAHVYCGMPRGYPGYGGRARVAQQLSAVTGACLLVRRAVYEEVGGLDESLRVAFNDIDFCLRVREAGYRNLWTPFAELYHHESASRGKEDTDEKRARFVGEVEAMLQRWGPQLQADPAYNPNLSLSSLNAEYAFPPRQ